MKKAASLFGIALELYRDNTEEEYFQTIRGSYYPDTWTPEAEEKHKKQLDILYKMLEEYQWTIDDISYYVSLVTDGAYTNFKKMPPEYIDDLLMAIKEDA